jgi:hypothetical protein
MRSALGEVPYRARRHGRDGQGRTLGSGVCFARLVAAGEERSQKLVLSK